MTLAEAETAAARPGLPRRRQWLVWVLLAVSLASVALTILASVASRYQPIGNGEDLSFAFPGLPAGKGFRVADRLAAGARMAVWRRGCHGSLALTPGRSAKRALASKVRTVRSVWTAWAAMIRSCAPRGAPARRACAISLAWQAAVVSV